MFFSMGRGMTEVTNVVLLQFRNSLRQLQTCSCNGVQIQTEVNVDHLSGQRYPEGLSAENQFLGQRQEGGVDGNGQLHGQLWRDD